MSSASIRFTLPDAVVVTGASSGLGQELCRMLIENGVDTIGVDVAAATWTLPNDTRMSGATPERRRPGTRRPDVSGDPAARRSAS